jgi:hypothetical protein
MMMTMTTSELALTGLVAGWLWGGIVIACYGKWWNHVRGAKEHTMAVNVMLVLIVFAWPVVLGERLYAWTKRRLSRAEG